MSDPPPPAFSPPQTTVISTGTALLREYRKGNWTLQETLTLITAKRLDEQRRSRPSTSSSSSPPPSKPAGELRWKWVENYCWDHGCYRSQNQCNDKWDNLLRDYKKVRNYQSQSDGSDRFLSYWSMDRGTRKLHNLPTNMSPEVFTALNDVVQAKYGSSPPLLLPLPSPPPSSAAAAPQEEQGRRDEVISADPTTAPPNEEAVAPPASVSGRSDSSSESESGDQSQSPEPKSKKIRKIGSSIRRSAAVLTRTIRSCEERKDQRHREIIELEQRRLRMEESRDEVNRKGIADLVAAVTNLSGAIQSLVASRYNHT